MSVVTLYTRAGCHLCEQAHAALECMRDELGFELQERDIAADPALLRSYFDRIPVVTLDGVELCDCVLDEQAVRAALASAAAAPSSRPSGQAIL